MSTTITAATPSRLGWLAAGALVGVIGVIAAGSALSTARAADDDDGATEHTLSVSGIGRVFVKPDVADLTVGVQFRRDRADDASVDAAAAMDAVVKALIAQGVAEDDIQTAQLSLQPYYDYDTSPARLVGYEATNLVSIVIRDLAKAGPLVDAAVEAGATNVSSITFRVEDPTAVETQAREAAMADARAKADTLAASGGVNITGVITIVEGSSPSPMPIYFEGNARAAAMDEAAQTPVLSGNVELIVSVSVVYSIE